MLHSGAAGSAGRMLPDALGDLLLGSRCVGCARPGRVLCRTCAATLPETAVPTPGRRRPRPASSYRSRPRSTTAWCGPWCWPTRSAAYSTWPRPLGWLLGGAVAAALADRGTGPVVLVPVPSRPASVRSRGHDPTLVITVRVAAAASDGPTRHGGASAATAARRAGPGRSRRRGAPREPRRFDALPEPSPGAAGRPAAARPRRGLRRRADHRRHRARGAARARGGRPGGGRDRGGGGDPPTYPRNGKFWGTPFVATRHGLTSVHGVRPGPWLRRVGAPRSDPEERSDPASRCQSQAKRST